MYDEFFLLGDSITQQGYSSGWVSLLSDAYIRRLRIINNGLSGYNTSQALRVLPKILSPYSPSSSPKIRIATLFFGANDARLPETGAQHIPIQEFKENLKKIVTTLEKHAPKIILMTPPPINMRMADAGNAERGIMETHRTAPVTASYAQAVRDVGKELDLPVLDVWSAFMSRTGWKEGDSGPLPGSKENDEPVLPTLLSDGLHLTPKGNQIVYEELLELIAKKWPDQIPEKIESPLPMWDEPAENWSKYGV